MVHNFPILDEIAPTPGLPWCERPPAIAYVGSISVRRGIRKILEGLALLPSDLPAQMMLAGPLSPGGLLPEIEVLPGRARVQYLGVLDRPGVAHLLSRARLGVVVLQPEPNFVNARPIKLFEYMAAGIPVIASDFPLWRRIIDGAGCGLLVDPQDSGAIARAIQYLLTHEAEAEAMGRRGRQAACELYNWSTEEHTLLQFYSKLLKTQAPEKKKEDEKISSSSAVLKPGLSVSTRAKYQA